MNKISDLIHDQSHRLIRILIIAFLILSPLTLSNVQAAGEAGWALSFDGVNDYVALGLTDDIIGVNWKTTKSISAWIKPTGDPKECSDNGFDDVAFCDAIIIDQPHFFGISRGILNGEDRIWVWNFDGTTTKIGVTYEIDQWVNITLVHANGSLKMYRNGNLINSIPSGATYLDQQVIQTNLQIGAFLKDGATSGAFQGLIDEVRIYSTEISEQSISDTLRTNLIGDEAGLAAYYQMSDGSGLTLTDDSVNDWTGALLDGTPYVSSNGSYPLWVSSGAFDYPVADDQLVSVQEDAISFPVTLTGSSPNSSELTFILDSEPVNGILDGTEPNLTYTPAPDFNGSDQFSFHIYDGTYHSTSATVLITVTPVNDAPLAISQSVSTDEDASLNITLTGSDVDAGDVLSFEIVTDPVYGNLTGSAEAWTYNPDPNFSGSDSFTFRVFDGTVYSDPATVSIQVNPINDAPIADPQDLSTNEDTNLPITLAGQDVDGDLLTFRVVSQPSHGSLTGSGANRIYHPNLNFNGTDSFTFVVNDTYGDSSPATINITVDAVNDAPVAADDQYFVNQNDVLVVPTAGVLENDSDIDGDAITAQLVTDVQHGSLTLNTDGSLSYSPVAGFFGEDSFTYRATDGTLNSNTVTVQILIQQVIFNIYLPVILK